MRRRLLYGKEESECTCDSVGSCFDVIIYEELDPESHVSANTQGPIPQYIIPYTGDSADVGEVIICGGTNCNCLDFDVVEGTIGSDLISCYRDDTLITIAADANPYTTDFYNKYYIEFRNKSTSATCDDDPFVQWIGVTLQANPGGGGGCINSSMTITYDFSSSGMQRLMNENALQAFSGMRFEGSAEIVPVSASCQLSQGEWEIDYIFDTNIGNYIQEGSFSGLSSITDVYFETGGNCLTVINKDAFKSCSNLRSVRGGNICISGDSVFSYCTSLSSITASLREDVGASAFTECTSLTGEVILLDTKKIGDYAFFNSYVQEVDWVSGHPSELGHYALCSYDFKKLCMKEALDIPSVYHDSIQSDNAFVICVPNGSGSTFSSNVNWSYYTSRIDETCYCGD